MLALCVWVPIRVSFVSIWWQRFAAAQSVHSFVASLAVPGTAFTRDNQMLTRDADLGLHGTELG